MSGTREIINLRLGQACASSERAIQEAKSTRKSNHLIIVRHALGKGEAWPVIAKKIEATVEIGSRHRGEGREAETVEGGAADVWSVLTAGAAKSLA